MNIFVQRQQQLQSEMSKRGIAGFLVNHYLDMYYYSGSMQTGYLFIPAVGESMYFVRRSISRAAEEAAAHVEPIGSMKTLKDRIAARNPRLFEATGADAVSAPVRFATELDVLPVQHFQRLEAAFAGIAWEDGSHLVREQRMLKSPDEVTAIKWLRSLWTQPWNQPSDTCESVWQSSS
jgi:Xaa-Pro dipeptidase